MAMKGGFSWFNVKVYEDNDNSDTSNSLNRNMRKNLLQCKYLVLKTASEIV